MTRIDTNIFRDISTTRNKVPTDQGIAEDLADENIRIMRLKSASYWIEYVCMVPTEPDWHKKQQALLNNENPIDSLIVNGFNILDANDLASVNRIHEDSALLHQQMLKRLVKKNPHN